MPISPERAALIESTLPDADITRKRLQDYLTRTDLSKPQFAKMCGYSYAAISQFLQGTYTKYSVRTDVLVRKCIEDTIARHPIDFAEMHTGGVLYETENVADLRRWFLHCHNKRALAYCYGPPGSQKTFVLKHLVSEFNRRELPRPDARNRAYYVRASVGMRPRDLMVKLCQASGAISASTLQRCMYGLRAHLVDTKTLFVPDEAQHLSIDCLEALREMHDEAPRIGVLLAGSHNLKLLFDRRASELEQWNSRIDAGIELEGVSEERAALIIRTELPSLSGTQVARLLEGALVSDAYSRTNKSYFNMRRLFKSVEATREALEARKPKKEIAA